MTPVAVAVLLAALVAAPVYWITTVRRLRREVAETRALVVDLRDRLQGAAECIAGEWGFDAAEAEYSLIERVDVLIGTWPP